MLHVLNNIFFAIRGRDEKGCKMAVDGVDQRRPGRKEQDGQRRPVEKGSGRRRPVEKGRLVDVDQKKKAGCSGRRRRLHFSRLTAGSPFNHAPIRSHLKFFGELIPFVCCLL